MNIEIIRNDNKTTRLTVNKSRTTIKLSTDYHDDQGVINFLIRVAEDVYSNLTTTMRGGMDQNGIMLFNDSKTVSTNYYDRSIK